MVTLTCNFCKKEYAVWDCVSKKSKYCSKKCSAKSQSKKIEKLCEVCDVVFLVSPSKGRIKTCSVKCGGIVRRTKSKVKCTYCHKTFEAPKCRIENNLVKYCSRKCFGKNNRGTDNYLWKGKKASYRTIHHWVTRHYGKAHHCISCGLNSIPKGMKRYFQWANISGEYKRDISDWKQLCVKCHKIFDKK